MALKKINRQDIEKMHRSGALKKVGTIKVQTEDGQTEKLSGTKFRDYLIEKNKKYKTLTSLEEAVRKDTAKTQWRQRAKFSKALKEPEAPKKSLSDTKAEKLQRKKTILDTIFARPKEEKKPIRREMIRAGRVNLKTGEYEEDSMAGKSSISVAQRPDNVMPGGVGGRVEQSQKSQASALGQPNNAIGIGGNKGGFKTIGSAIDKK